MAIRSARKGGTNLGDEKGKPSQWNDTFDAFYRKAYADNTGGSTGSTSETDLATLTISQNDLGSNFSATIFAGIRGKGQQDQSNNATLRLYVNGSVVKTITLRNSTGSGSADSGSAFTYLASSLDSTAGDIIIKVTGQNSNSTGGSAICDGLVVDAIYNNT